MLHRQCTHSRKAVTLILVGKEHKVVPDWQYDQHISTQTPSSTDSLMDVLMVEVTWDHVQDTVESVCL